MKRISFRRLLVFFLLLDLLFVLAAMLLIIAVTRVFKHTAPDSMELSFANGESDVVLLEISKEYSWVTMSKSNKNSTLWLGEDSDSPAKTLWPCDAVKVERLAAEVQKTFHASKKADGVSSWKRLGLSERDCFKVKVRQQGKEAVTWRFSSLPAAEQLVIFRTPSDQTVWEAQTDIGSFFSTAPSFWADPCAIPAFASGGGGVKRGDLFCLMPASHLKPTAVHEAIFDGGISATFSVYKKEDEYVVRPTFSCEATPDVSLISYGYLLDEAALAQLIQEIAR